MTHNIFVVLDRFGAVVGAGVTEEDAYHVIEEDCGRSIEPYHKSKRMYKSVCLYDTYYITRTTIHGL